MILTKEMKVWLNLKRQTRDAAKSRAKVARERFNNSRKAEKQYGRQLRAVARQIGMIVKGMTEDGEIKNPTKLMDALTQYSKLLNPWARSVAKKMIDEVSVRDEKSWYDLGNEIGRSLKKEIATTPVGHLLTSRLEEQVELITSLPLKAAKRVHKLTLEGIVSGTRAVDIAAEIRRTGEVSESLAMLTARTEVARTASLLTESRAKHVGSDGYFWRTAKDADVRDSHREMEGKFVRWDQPPTLSDGTTTHAGQIYNCRCYPEPYLPELD